MGGAGERGTREFARTSRDPLGSIRSDLVDIDWFHGLLVRAGVPLRVLPGDGRRLSPEEAVRLLSWVMAADVPLREFGPWRMASHLLLEAAQEGAPVSRQVLHERMRRFAPLLVLRPDGHLVRVVNGSAVQHVGEVQLENGALRAEGFEVGPFYTVRGRFLYPVDSTLTVHPDARLAGVFMPDEDTLAPVVQGAGQATLDTVSGLVSLVLHPVDSVAGLAQLPGAVRELIVNSPAYWEQFRSLPHGAQVRGASRIITNLLLVFGTAGAGSTRVASVASKMKQLSVPVLSLSAEGSLALRMVAVPAGQRVTSVSAGPRALYILHMANQGAGSASGGNTGQSLAATSPGPGKWVRKKPFSSERSNRYQEQISGRPAEEVYVIDDVEYDGFKNGILVEAKGPGYRSFFQADATPEPWYDASGKFQQLLKQARNQSRSSRGLPVQWHVAEAEVAEFLRSHFLNNRIVGIDVIHTPARALP